LKQRLAREVNLNVGVLPYRAEVVAFVREQRAAGQRTILATASDESVARAVAAQVGVFDDVIASDGHSNLRGPAKLRAVRQRLGGGAFDYIGDSSADMAMWEAARQAFVVGSKRQLRRAAQVCSPTEIETAPRGGCQGLVKALRPQQWAKNVLLGVPLIVSHNLGHWADVMAVAVAFVAFGMAASAIYLVNDLLDLEADRQHPRKCRRPFASGRVSVQAGAAAVVPLLLGSALLALGMLPVGFVGMLGMYVALSLAYSLYLKRKMLVDVFCLAGLYTLRILAGAVAIGVVVSPWLLAFSMFLFLSLAFVKRYSELKLMGGGSQGAARGRGYVAGDLETFRSMGPTSGYLAVLVLCLYINSADVLKLYHRPGLLWLVCPVVLYWITRIWFLVQRYEMPDDPVNFALRDRVSYLAGAVIAAIIALATVS
jgi:4-hydroxybenzoate polyprenyltransferase